MAEVNKFVKRHLGALWIRDDAPDNFWCTGNENIELLEALIAKAKAAGITDTKGVPIVSIKVLMNRYRKNESHPDLYIDEDSWRMDNKMEDVKPSDPEPGREPAPF